MTPALLVSLAPDGLTAADVAEIQDIPEPTAVLVLDHHRRQGLVTQRDGVYYTSRLEWEDIGALWEARVGRLRVLAWHTGWVVWRWLAVSAAEIQRSTEGRPVALSARVARGSRATLEANKAAAEAAVARITHGVAAPVAAQGARR